MTSSSFVYVLKLQQGKWYVGITSKPVEDRFIEHVSGFGSAWTRRYQPIEIADVRFVGPSQDARALEAKETYLRMMVYGVNNVRGGPRTEVADYNEQQLEILVTDIGHWLGMRFEDVRQRLQLPPRANWTNSSSVHPNLFTTTPNSAETRTFATTTGSAQPSLSETATRNRTNFSVGTTSSAQPSSFATTRTAESNPGLNSPVPFPFHDDRRRTPSATPAARRQARARFPSCALCSRMKPPEQDKPLCYECWSNQDGSFRYCPCCGDRKNEDPERPLCQSCYRSWTG